MSPIAALLLFLTGSCSTGRVRTSLPVKHQNSGFYGPVLPTVLGARTRHSKHFGSAAIQPMHSTSVIALLNPALTLGPLLSNCQFAPSAPSLATTALATTTTTTTTSSSSSANAVVNRLAICSSSTQASDSPIPHVRPHRPGSDPPEVALSTMGSSSEQTVCYLPALQTCGSEIDDGPHCRRCRNHGRHNPWKGHKKTCPFSDCNCPQCILISMRKSNEKCLRKHFLYIEPLEFICLLDFYPQVDLVELSKVYLVLEYIEGEQTSSVDSGKTWHMVFKRPSR
ncbi:unnamed protein product, partial [Protopolystoma xenopodis]